VKIFYGTLGAVVAFAIIFVAVHSCVSDKDVMNGDLQSIVSATRLGTLSFGGDSLGGRVEIAYKASNALYPEMMPIERRGFVYEN